MSRDEPSAVAGVTAPVARALFRIGWRTARREWRRTSLIALLVAVPVAVAVVVAGVLRIQDLTPAEEVTARHGRADVVIEVVGSANAPELARLETVTDAAIEKAATAADGDVEVARLRRYYDGAATGAGGNVVSVTGATGVVDGNLVLREGRLPRTAEEVAVSPVRQGSGANRLGDVVELPDGREAEVVGLVRSTIDFPGTTTVVTDDTFATLPQRDAEATQRWLMAGMADPAAFLDNVVADVRRVVPEPTSEQRDEAFTEGRLLADFGSAVTRSDLLLGYEQEAALASALAGPSVIATLVAGLLLAEVALIAGTAYATGTRRRLRELGLLGAGGATVAHLRGIVLAEAGVTGLVGGVVGSVVGVLGLVLGSSVLERFLTEYAVGLDLAVSDVVGPVLAATVALVVAAWLPSRTAARVPTVTALAGRMPQSAPSRWVAPAGVATAALGCVVLLVALTSTSQSAGVIAALGVLLAVGGTALLTGPLIELAGRQAHRLPSVWRLVVRDSARQRTRASAAAASALVLFLVPVMVGTGFATSASTNWVNGLPARGDQVWVTPPQEVGAFDDDARDLRAEAIVRQETLDTVRQLLPTSRHTEVVVLDQVARPAPGQGFGRADGGDADVFGPSDSVWERGLFSPGSTLAAEATPELLAALGNDAVTAAIEADEVVVLGLDDRTTTVTFERVERDVAARELPVPMAQYYAPRVLVPPTRLAPLELFPAELALDLFVGPVPVEVNNTLVFEPYIGVSVDEVAANRRIRAIALAVSFALALLVLALVTGLSATESDRDLRTMVAVGARPVVRRWFLGAQTGYHALAGAVLAVPLGIGLFAVLARAEDSAPEGVFGRASSGDLTIGWSSVVLTLVVAPLVIAGVTALLVRSAPTVPPRRLG